MRHKYERHEVPGSLNNTFNAYFVCKVCGLRKLGNVVTGKQTFWQYSRNGILCFQGAPDCVDIEKENLKTID